MKKFLAPVFATCLIFGVSFAVLGDTIRLKDGSVIKGQVVGFKDQQFIVLLGNGEKGRRSRITVYMEDVESIDFDSTNLNASSSPSSSNTSDDNNSSTQPEPTQPEPTRSEPSRPSNSGSNYPRNSGGNSGSSGGNSNSSPNPSFFTVNAHVRGDNAANGWANTGLVVRKGQRIRISASGRVGIGNGRFSTPAGLPTLPDGDKLMRNEATGALIAVVGDDNDDFILVGTRREFTALRVGVLFLGVNEGNLNDNTGSYDAVIEAEAISGGR
ncbi:MAG: hypothetical protein QOH96_19 [Blastocatellia bacterium]|nr:hypothetical protein [Blastocatellia bacterium]